MNHYKVCIKAGEKLLIRCILIMGWFFSSSMAARAPINPDPSSNARALLEYLYSISGKKILSGQQENNNQPESDLIQVQKATGHLPALVGDDLGWGSNQDALRKILVSDAIRRWNEKGMLLALSWHTCPVESRFAKDDCAWSDINKAGPSATIDSILTPGTSQQKLWFEKMDKAAESLKKLRDAGVPVLWRPFHEMNGAWFWWGKQPRLKELWIQEQERFTNLHKLNNLIWVYSPNCEMSYTESFDENYPGGRYVDVLGMDLYTQYGHAWLRAHHDKLWALGEGRPIAICENGVLPDPDLLTKEQPNWVWFNTWSGFLLSNPEGWVKAVYQNPRVITQEGLPILNTTKILKLEYIHFKDNMSDKWSKKLFNLNGRRLTIAPRAEKR